MATRKAAEFTVEKARAVILTKLGKAGAKGGSPIPPATTGPRRVAMEEALRQLARDGAISAVPSGGKTKFYLREFAPSVERASEKIDRFAAMKHPSLLALPQFKPALSAVEKGMLASAVEKLETERRLIQLRRGATPVYGHGDSLRALLGAAPPRPAPLDAPAIQSAYQQLVQRTGFPAVEISALQKASAIPMDELKRWLLAELHAGRAVFALGDWSLADEATRAGAVELRGDRHLLVRLEAE